MTKIKPEVIIRERFLRKLMVEKVVTQSDMIKELDGKAINPTNSYKVLVAAGFPIRRRVLDPTASNKGSTKSIINHRNVVYYIV